MLATLKGAVYVERVSMHDIKNIKNAKNAIKKAFKVQQAGLGFSIVEVLSSCPTNWGLDPVQALKWVEEN
jgi:2-oxoglutarate ferredoxin oxidoreductase subunit beta